VKGQFRQKFGLYAILFSFGLWGAVALVPFLSLGIASATITIAVLLVVSEFLFWLGIMLVGKQLAERYRQKLNPRAWLNKLKK
jgi:hypothetical protein